MFRYANPRASRCIDGKALGLPQVNQTSTRCVGLEFLCIELEHHSRPMRTASSVHDMRRASGSFIAYFFSGFELLCDDSPLTHGHQSSLDGSFRQRSYSKGTRVSHHDPKVEAARFVTRLDKPAKLIVVPIPQIHHWSFSKIPVRILAPLAAKTEGPKAGMYNI